MKPGLDVEFIINSDLIHPDEITRLIGISPTQIWLKGERIYGTKLIRKTNSWCFSIEADHDTYNLGDRLENLVEFLAPKADIIAQICQKYALYSEFACSVDVIDEAPAINITSRTILTVAKIGAALDIDIVLTE